MCGGPAAVTISAEVGPASRSCRAIRWVGKGLDPGWRDGRSPVPEAGGTGAAAVATPTKPSAGHAANSPAKPAASTGGRRECLADWMSARRKRANALTANAAGAGVFPGGSKGGGAPLARARMLNIAWAGLGPVTGPKPALRTPAQSLPGHRPEQPRPGRRGQAPPPPGRGPHRRRSGKRPPHPWRRRRALCRALIFPLPLPLGNPRSSLRRFHGPYLPRNAPSSPRERPLSPSGVSGQISAPALRSARYSAQSSISRRRRSNRSVRRYAASTGLRTTCASAASATSRG